MNGASPMHTGGIEDPGAQMLDRFMCAIPFSSLAIDLTNYDYNDKREETTFGVCF